MKAMIPKRGVIRIEDGRYIRDIYVDGVDADGNTVQNDKPAFQIAMNPVNPFAFEYFERLYELDFNGADREAQKAAFHEMRICVDGIFGKGTTDAVCQYMNIRGDAFMQILNEMFAVYKEVADEAKKQTEEAKKAEIIAAKKESAAFVTKKK